MALQSTGYQAAIQSVAWAAGQGLDGLTDNEWSDLSDAIDNSTNRYVTADIAIELASAAFTGDDSTIEVYVIPSVDGTNYGVWSGNITADTAHNNQYFVGAVTTTGATETQADLVLRNVVVPPGLWRLAFRNRSNVTLAGTGNAAGWRPHSFEDA